MMKIEVRCNSHSHCHRLNAIIWEYLVTRIKSDASINVRMIRVDLKHTSLYGDIEGRVYQLHCMDTCALSEPVRAVLTFMVFQIN